MRALLLLVLSSLACALQVTVNPHSDEVRASAGVCRGGTVIAVRAAELPRRAYQLHPSFPRCTSASPHRPLGPAQCFFEEVQAGNKLTGSFEVISGGVFDIDATVFGPKDEAHYSVLRQRSGHFTVLAPMAGNYRLCFSSRMSTMVPKKVAFSMHKGDELYRDMAKQEHITPLEEEVSRLQDALALVEDEQEYMWARERATAESEWEERKSAEE